MSSNIHPLVLQRALPSTLSAYHEFFEEVLSTLQKLVWSEHEL